MDNNELLKILTDKRPVSCAVCGGRLQYLGGGEYKCMDCGEKCLDDFGKVRNFLYENGAASAQVISAATGVSERLVLEMLEEGRLEIVDKSKTYLRCRTCGCAIRYGKYCVDCAKKNSDRLKAELRDKEDPVPRIGVSTSRRSNNKMRYYNGKKT